MQRSMDRELETPDCQREKVPVAVERPGSIECVQDVVELFANDVNWANIMFIVSDSSDPEVKTLFYQCALKMYRKLKNKEFQVWFDRYGKRQPQLYLILACKADQISTELASFAQHSSVIEVMRARQAHKLRTNPKLQNIVRLVFLFDRELSDKIALGSIFVSLQMQQTPRFKPLSSKRLLLLPRMSRLVSLMSRSPTTPPTIIAVKLLEMALFPSLFRRKMLKPWDSSSPVVAVLPKRCLGPSRASIQMLSSHVGITMP
jgi:hypothetical protein